MSHNLKYPWQRALVEAFLASADSLIARINVAEKAIAARLIDPHPADHEERIALNDALRALRVLMQEVEARTRPAPTKKDEETGYDR